MTFHATTQETVRRAQLTSDQQARKVRADLLRKIDRLMAIVEWRQHEYITHQDTVLSLAARGITPPCDCRPDEGKWCHEYIDLGKVPDRHWTLARQLFEQVFDLADHADQGDYVVPRRNPKKNTPTVMLDHLFRAQDVLMAQRAGRKLSRESSHTDEDPNEGTEAVILLDSVAVLNTRKQKDGD
jgi:hypothetical protein